jgi:hypothetical protein
VAIVVASNGIEGSARHFEEASAAKRPVRIFRDLYAARVWLDEIAPPDLVPEVMHGQLDAATTGDVLPALTASDTPIPSEAVVAAE